MVVIQRLVTALLPIFLLVGFGDQYPTQRRAPALAVQSPAASSLKARQYPVARDWPAPQPIKTQCRKEELEWNTGLCCCESVEFYKGTKCKPITTRPVDGSKVCGEPFVYACCTPDWSTNEFGCVPIVQLDPDQ